MNRLLTFSVLMSVITFGSCTPSTPESYEVKDIPFPGLTQSSLPVLAAGDSTLVFSWVSMVNDSTSALFYAFLEKGEKWSEPKLITQGADWFVNWADFPTIVQHKGNLLSHILQKSSPEKFSYDVKLNMLPSGENQWKTGLALHKDSTFTEHGFVSAMALSDSSFFVTWLDGRNTGGSGHDHSGHSGAMSIRAAAVQADGKVLWDEQLDARTCDCCQTTSALTDNGPVVLYRNRSDREIRDIAITRLVDGKWTEPKIIHADGWEIAGCPVNGPKVAARGPVVLTAWFTAAGEIPQVKFAFSTDSGENFEVPVRLGGNDVIGRVDVALIDSTSGIVSWIETLNGETFLMAAHVDSDGKVGSPVRVTGMDPSRKSGFPQLELLGDQVYFAWTEVSAEGPLVRTAYLPIKAF